MANDSLKILSSSFPVKDGYREGGVFFLLRLSTTAGMKRSLVVRPEQVADEDERRSTKHLFQGMINVSERTREG